MRFREKKHIVGVLMLTLAAILVPKQIVFADEANVHFGSSSYTATEGDPFNVGLYIDTEQGVGNYVVTVKYDPSTLEYVGGADAADVQNGVLSFSGQNGGPEVKYLVNFNVVGTGDSSVSVASAAVANTESTELLPTSVSSSAPIKVEEKEEEEEEPEEEAEEKTEKTVTKSAKVTEAASEKTDVTPEATAQADESNIDTGKETFLHSTFFIVIAVILALVIIGEIVFIVFRVRFEKKRKRQIAARKAARKKQANVNKVSEKKSSLNADDDVQVMDLEDVTDDAELEDDVVIDVQDVTMEFKVASAQTNGIKDYIIHLLKRQISYRKFFALDHVSFSVKKGEVVGIIGTNGSGKSTILKIVSGALRPTSGNVEVDRRKVQLLTLGTGFDMELTGRENVYLNGAIIGYSKKFLDDHYDEIVEFAELQDFMDEKVKNYSSGMVSRLGFAIATAGDAAEILILDEVLSVGDEFFRKKSLARVKEMIHGGSTVLLVSHSMPTIKDNCSKVVWIEKGELRMIGTPDVVCEAYQKMNEEGIPAPIKVIEVS